MPKQVSADEELEFISVAEEHRMNNNMRNPPGGMPRGDAAGEGGFAAWLLGQSRHPLVLLFHLLFKSLAILVYVFGSWITTNFIFTFVLCIVFLAFDFWTVKNVSGRLLVGLRWWSYVKDDGSNEWIFESLEDMADVSAVDSRVFWGSLYVTPAAWTLLLVVGVLRLKFEYLPIVLAAIIMSMANTIGYLKCSSSADSKVKSLMEQGRGTALSGLQEGSGVSGWLLGSLLSMSGSGAK